LPVAFVSELSKKDLFLEKRFIFLFDKM